MSNQINEQMRLDLSGKLELIVRSDDDFPIDFEEAWEWIGFARKDSAKRCLYDNFVENVEFGSFPPKSGKSPAGRPREIIKLTKDCFKALCMIAQTDKGKEVRKYYLEIEARYRDLVKTPKSRAHALLHMSKMLTQQMEVLVEHEERLSEHDDKIEELEDRIGEAQKLAIEASSKNSGDTDYVTVIGYINSSGNKSYLSKNTQIGRLAATKRCRERGIEIGKVPDERYGHVNSYPRDVIEETCNDIFGS